MAVHSLRPAYSKGTNHHQWLPRGTRKVHHKVKTGCKACKVRHQKCDELRPICLGCSRHSTQCQYPEPARFSSPDDTSQVASPRASAVVPVRLALSNSVPVPPPPADLCLDDLELLHQFLTSTCIAAGQLPEITAQVQKTILPTAKAYPFVMHGVLAMAATELSWVRAPHHKHYSRMAAHHHHQGLSDFRSALTSINQDNCHAIISYSKSLLWCSFADDASMQHQTKVIISEPGQDWLPQWFSLLRGSCHVVEFPRPWIKEGQHVRNSLTGVDYYKMPDDEQICTLMATLPFVAASPACEVVLLATREAFARAAMSHHNVPLRDAINFWVASLPVEYIELLQHDEPWTLVLLAYFSVLVHRLEADWFRKGHARQLIMAIVNKLDDRWKFLVQWPCHEADINTNDWQFEMSFVLSTRVRSFNVG